MMSKISTLISQNDEQNTSFYSNMEFDSREAFVHTMHSGISGQGQGKTYHSKMEFENWDITEPALFQLVKR